MFGNWVYRRRKQLDFTQEDLARKISCSVSMLRKIEKDERRPSEQLAELLANHLAIDESQRDTFLKAARGKFIQDMDLPLRDNDDLKFPAVKIEQIEEHSPLVVSKPHWLIPREQLPQAMQGRGSMVYNAGEAGRGKTGLSDTRITRGKRHAEKMGGPEIRHLRGISRPVFAIIGVISFLVVFLLILSGVFNASSQAVEDKEAQFPTAGSVSQKGSSSLELVGATVRVLAPFKDAQAKLFMQSMMPFEERSGIDVVLLRVQYPYETYLAARLESSALPDIALFPQPSWLAELIKQGKAVDVRTFLDDDYLQQQYPDAFLDLATVDGKVMGVWHTVGLKSLVWYPKQAFEAKGYEVPGTWDELIALSDRIVADGGTPWCIGIEEGDFTGWVGTDWVEDILLRTAPPEAYDAWVRHELPFNSPEIRRVFEIMGQIWLNDDYVYGGTANISKENVIVNPVHLFKDPPGCYLHKQASFAPFFFPQTFDYGRDYDFFYLPPIDPEFGKPVLGSGEIFAMFNDRPEVREVMRYLTTVEATKTMIENGGFLSPHRATPIEWFPSAADLRFAQIVLSADTYRFDASDLMPVEVGLGSFYRGITDWVKGADLETVLIGIDDSWSQ